MDAVVDMIPIGEAVLPVKVAPEAPIDLLDRQEIVNRIMQILEVISKNKSSCTFALNGAWGTGKTFVLNMLMNQLWEGYSDKYIVFHYNCWQYDYYEEPLIAIVAAMLDSVDEKTHLLSEDVRTEVKAGIELAKDALKKIGISLLEKKIGVDFTEALSVVKQYQEAIDNEKQALEDSRSFDVFYSFKKAIEQAQEEIRKLSKDHTLVVVVDELDRCLPSYAIKVLERLHHLFASIENSAVFLAVDKSQLDKTISQIFGDGTDTTKYLRKFVNLELELDAGKITGSFWKKHFDYFELFDPLLIDTDFPFEDFVNALFSGIDARTQERLMDRINTVHRILFPYGKKDYSVMCCELMWIVLSVYYGVTNAVPYKHAYDQQKNSCFALTLNVPFKQFFDKLWSSNSLAHYERHTIAGRFLYLSGTSKIQKLLIYYLDRLIYPQNSSKHHYIHKDEFETIDFEDNLAFLSEVRDLLRLIQ